MIVRLISKNLLVGRVSVRANYMSDELVAEVNGQPQVLLKTGLVQQPSIYTWWVPLSGFTVEELDAMYDATATIEKR